MVHIKIKIYRSEIKIPEKVFTSLFGRFLTTKRRASYKKALVEKKISLQEIKKLCLLGKVPLPLVFANPKLIAEQIKNEERNLQKALPNKKSYKWSSRGAVTESDIDLLLKDIAQKQIFLDEKIKPKSKDNQAALFLKKIDKNTDIRHSADLIRTHFNINLEEIAGRNKDYNFEYFRQKLELANIYISESTHPDFMPQRLDSDMEFSALYVYDKKFPFIFINRKDYNDEVEIMEPTSRKILSMFYLLSCVVRNIYICDETKKDEKDETRWAYNLALEILVPQDHTALINIKNIEELESAAAQTPLTPSALLMKLFLDKRMSSSLKKVLYKEVLIKRDNYKQELEKGTFKGKRPYFGTAYETYNGKKFVKEVLTSFSSGSIDRADAVKVLFRDYGKKNKTNIEEFFQRNI